MKKEKGKVKSEKGTAKPTITLDDVHEDVATWENQKVEKRTAKPKMKASEGVASFDIAWMGVRAKTQDFIDTLRIHRASVKTSGERKALTTTIDKLYRFLGYASSAAGLVEKGGAK